jgi:hypothetical protein
MDNIMWDSRVTGKKLPADQRHDENGHEEYADADLDKCATFEALSDKTTNCTTDTHGFTCGTLSAWTDVPIEVELNTKGLIDMRQMSEGEADHVDLLSPIG